jgi:hypothetical protein
MATVLIGMSKLIRRGIAVSKIEVEAHSLPLLITTSLPDLGLLIPTGKMRIILQSHTETKMK